MFVFPVVSLFRLRVSHRTQRADFPHYALLFGDALVLGAGVAALVHRASRVGEGWKCGTIEMVWARAVRVSADGLTYRFLLRTEARFQANLAMHNIL
jgi:hypothetical protein